MTPHPSAERLESGDRAEMERVFTAEAPGLVRTVRALMCRATGVDDVVQEVFVIAFTRLETFEGRTSVVTDPSAVDTAVSTPVQSADGLDAGSVSVAIQFAAPTPGDDSISATLHDAEGNASEPFVIMFSAS